MTDAEYFGSLVEWITWGIAPNAELESLKLEALKPEIMTCDTDQIVGSMKSSRTDLYDKVVVELQRATNAQMEAQSVDRSQLRQPMQSLPPSSRGFKQILELPETYEELFSEEPERGLALEEFYDRNELRAEPYWMTKVDNQQW